MKTWSKVIPMLLGAWGWVLAGTSGISAAPADTGAIQAIQQATDPSAAVAAFANGFAIDRNNPKLYDAYVTRMVDLGLPELAYHQAEALTTLDANNGLGWGVVGYVNARRGDMPAAVSAIVLAGQAAPDNQFVQRTAGEILAWYDLKADKTQIADNAKSGLDALRAKFGSSAAFTQAYDTAKKAYAGQTNAQQPSVQQTAPAQQAAPAQPYYQTEPYSAGPPAYADYYGYPGPYYSSYYYDWGPGWLAPSPFWWWYPCGFFTGFSFFPFSSVVVFDGHHHHHDDFDHHHHDHDGIHVHNAQGFHHDPNNQTVWHRTANGQANFFGMPTQPNAARVSHSTTVAGVTTANSAFASPATRANSVNAVRAASTTPGIVDPVTARAATPGATTTSQRGVSSALAAPSAQAASRAATATPTTTQRGVASALAAPSAQAAAKAAPAMPAAPLAQPRAAATQPRATATMTAPTLRMPTTTIAPRLSVPSAAPTMARPAASAMTAPSPSFGGMGRASAGGGGAMHGGGGGGGMHAGGGGGGGHGGGGGGHR